ncbi:MAG: hypothetical protein ACREND_04210 [Gemmatimonadaceae bacterium]
MYIVSNPEATSGGGEANGGRLVIEVPSPAPTGFVLHESLHFLLAHVQSYGMAIVIQPILRAALANGESVEAFLPQAIARWRTVSPRQNATNEQSGGLAPAALAATLSAASAVRLSCPWPRWPPGRFGNGTKC